MVVTTNPPPTRGFVSKRASPGALRDPLCAHSAPAPDKTVRPTVASRSSRVGRSTPSLIVTRPTTGSSSNSAGEHSLIAIRLEPAHGKRLGGGRVRVYANRPPDRTPSRHLTKAFCIDGRSGGTSKLIPKDTYEKSKSSAQRKFTAYLCTFANSLV